ncbi:hypothetical protein PQX77_019133 [Marasmius sp. AFHP31]|nr:hypothetical protein PQX77_019133 [Marasmius sp. AFHP31]
MPTIGEFEYVRWKADVYDFVRRWQLAKGFDPCTVEFARSVGASVYDIDLGLTERWASRFEEVCAEGGLCRSDCGEVSMAEISWDMDVDSPSTGYVMTPSEKRDDSSSICIDDMRTED